MNACQCCASPSGTPFTIQWNSVSATRNKVGFAPFSGRGNARYRKKVTVATASGSGAYPGSNGSCGASCQYQTEFNSTYSGTRSETQEYVLETPPNGWTRVDSTSGELRYTTTRSFKNWIEYPGGITIGGVNMSYTAYCSSIISPGTGCLSGLPSEEEGVYDPFGGEETSRTATVITKRRTSVLNPGVVDTVTTLSDEFTTAELESRVADALEFVNDTFPSGLPGSFRSIAPDESEIAARKGRWRLVHSPVATCYLKVWFRRKIVATVSGGITYEDIDPYVWDGSGSPCIENPNLSASHVSNRIFSDPVVMPVPSDNSTHTVEIVKFSYLSSYEPDISDPLNPQPDGFPDPTWEAAAP